MNTTRFFKNASFLLGCLLSLGCSLLAGGQNQLARTATPVSLSLLTASPTATPSITPTPAPNTLVPTVIPQSGSGNQSSSCIPRNDWPSYSILAGDTLGIIATRTGTTVDSLLSANCLANANLIYIGQQLRVPALIPTQVGPPTPNPGKVGGKVTVSPVLREENGWMILQPGAVVTISWPGAEKLGAVEVNFTLTLIGAQPTIIGFDYIISDGVAIQWTVPSDYDVQGYLGARAGSLGGRVLVDQTDTPVAVKSDSSSTGNVQIITFVGSPNPVQRGGTVTLTWNVVGAKNIRIDRYRDSAAGTPITDAWGSNPSLSGSVNYTLPIDQYFNSISFRLYANPGQASEVVKQVDIELSCPYGTIWFGCPIIRKDIDVGLQGFDGGWMVGRRDALKVYVLYSDSSWKVFNDTYTDGAPLYPSMPEDGSIPCLGKRPDRGSFAWLWMAQADVRQKLGCTTGASIAFGTPWEEHRGWSGDNPIVFDVFRWSDGRNLALVPANPWAFPPQ